MLQVKLMLEKSSHGANIKPSLADVKTRARRLSTNVVHVAGSRESREDHSRADNC